MPAGVGRPRVLRSVYRALLRAATPFSPPAPRAAARAALLHRSGVAHDWEGTARAADGARSPAAERAGAAGGDVADGNPKVALFRQLAQEWFAAVGGGAGVGGVGGVGGGGEAVAPPPWPTPWSPDAAGYFESGGARRRAPLKLFPSQFAGGPSLRSVVRREFRAPTVAERRQAEGDTVSEGHRGSWQQRHPSSSYVDTDVRLQTAFHALSALNRKLKWAHDMGLPHPSPPAQEEDGIERRTWAAEGVAPLGTTVPTRKDHLDKEPPLTPEKDAGGSNGASNAGDEASSSLRRGTYLIAHPLMRGYFARSVIVLLDHAEEREGADGSQSGGTYGLIVNRPARDPGAGALLRRLEEGGGPPRDAPIPLARAIQADDLPEAVQAAFGDSPVREGGPVNLSLQMLHRRKSEPQDDDGLQRKSGAPGGVKIEEDDDGSDTDVASGAGSPARSLSRIGGTPLPGAERPRNNSDNEEMEDVEETIYFGGSVMEASYAVADNSCRRDDFSFVIGATCWAPGQLADEIARGCWRPFRGPPRMALTGAATVATPPPAGRDVGGTARTAPGLGDDDLWRAVMCALGEGEADLARAMRDSECVNDELGDACDNFER